MLFQSGNVLRFFQSRQVPSMLNGYWDKLLQVSSDSSSLAPECLAELLQQKLKTLVVADRDSDQRQLVMGEQVRLTLMLTLTLTWTRTLAVKRTRTRTLDADGDADMDTDTENEAVT